jgi:hypothetical protein
VESPAFSSFRSLMDTWDMICEEREQVSKVHQLLDTQEFVFYFKLDGSIFGAPEESRIMYAKMKHPDEDMRGKWKDEANFLAVNLDDIIKGHGTQRIFSKKDLKNIKIIDKEEAAEDLGKKNKGKK